MGSGAAVRGSRRLENARLDHVPGLSPLRVRIQLGQPSLEFGELLRRGLHLLGRGSLAVPRLLNPLDALCHARVLHLPLELHGQGREKEKGRQVFT